jgi:hypothetical protein
MRPDRRRYGGPAIEGTRGKETTMSIAGRFAVAAGLTLLAGVAGCTTGGMYRQSAPIAALPQTGIEGAWIDQQGTGVTNFTAGRFETYATDTGEKLSEGTYTMRDATLAEINGFSLARQAPVAFNCALASTVQLNCTSSTGQQFVLTRRTGVS